MFSSFFAKRQRYFFHLHNALPLHYGPPNGRPPQRVCLLQGAPRECQARMTNNSYTSQRLLTVHIPEGTNHILRSASFQMTNPQKGRQVVVETRPRLLQHRKKDRSCRTQPQRKQQGCARRLPLLDKVVAFLAWVELCGERSPYSPPAQLPTDPKPLQQLPRLFSSDPASSARRRGHYQKSDSSSSCRSR